MKKFETLRNQINSQVCETGSILDRRVMFQMGNQVRTQVESQLSFQVSSQIYFQVETPIRNQLLVRIFNQTNQSVNSHNEKIS